jgi:hypothetical protein
LLDWSDTFRLALELSDPASNWLITLPENWTRA